MKTTPVPPSILTWPNTHPKIPPNESQFMIVIGWPLHSAKYELHNNSSVINKTQVNQNHTQVTFDPEFIQGTFRCETTS